MKKIVIGSLACLSILAASALSARSHGQPDRKVLSMHSMYGVDGAFVGGSNPIRGLVGDELPWEVGQATHGQLDAHGRLKLHVQGLVFADDPSVPPELRGTNDEAFFRAVVSCLTVDETTGAVVERNLFTDGFPATTSGDAEIDATVELPRTCVAPLVFVIAGSEDKWFAVTGVELEGD
jgi:hypothetical protein